MVETAVGGILQIARSGREEGLGNEKVVCKVLIWAAYTPPLG